MERTKTNNKHSFNGFFSMTTRVGWSLKAGKIAWDFTETRHDVVLRWQQSFQMETTCTSFQTDSHASTS